MQSNIQDVREPYTHITKGRLISKDYIQAERIVNERWRRENPFEQDKTGKKFKYLLFVKNPCRQIKFNQQITFSALALHLFTLPSGKVECLIKFLTLYK